MTPQECKHLKFTSYCAVGRIVSPHEIPMANEVKPVSVLVDLKIQCSDCGSPVIFTGLPIGSAKRGATTSFVGDELRASGGVKENLG